MEELNQRIDTLERRVNIVEWVSALGTSVALMLWAMKVYFG